MLPRGKKHTRLTLTNFKIRLKNKGRLLFETPLRTDDDVDDDYFEFARLFFNDFGRAARTQPETQTILFVRCIHDILIFPMILFHLSSLEGRYDKCHGEMYKMYWVTHYTS